MKNRRKRKVHRGRRKPNRFITWFKGLSKGKKAALISGVVVLVLLLSVGIFIASKFSKIQKVKIDPKDLSIDKEVEEKIGTGYTNFALFAGDSRTGALGKGVRSDGIIIASLNNETGEVKMISVYRDTLLNIGDDTYTKCNAAYSYGGAKQAVAMLNKNLDLNIKQFVTVDFKAVSETIDLLGGIEVDVSEAEVYATNKYINETARVAKKKAKKLTRSGLQTLNGVQATTYGRIRKGVGDDYARTERQRLIIQKTIEKALKSDLATLNKIVDKVLPMVYTNVTEADILSYATGLARYKVGESKGFPFDKTSATLAGRGSCVIPVNLADNVRQLHEFLFNKTDYTPSSSVSTISNKIKSLVGERTADPAQTYDPDSYKVPTDDKKDDKKDEQTTTTTPTKHTHKWSGWSAGTTHHWHECTNTGCDITDNTLKDGYGTHTGGQASCVSGAICSACGTAYGSTNPEYHANVEIRGAKEATTETEGYTGDRYCKDCNKLLESGQVTQKKDPEPTPEPGSGETTPAE